MFEVILIMIQYKYFQKHLNISCPINDIILFRQINIPVLPQGLQIMADQGFQNLAPVIVLPRRNQPAIAANVRRYKCPIKINIAILKKVIL